MAVLLFACGARAQAPAASPFTLKSLGHNVWAAIDDAKGDAGANAGFVIGEDSVAVIDTFENPEAARRLLEEIRKLTKLPVKLVINTHYHLDHVAGNGVFAEAGAVVVAQRNVRGWMRTENLKFFGKDIKPEQKAMVEGLVAPQVGYDDALELYAGSRHLIAGYYAGHTGGDTVVIIPDANVVFCGDLFWRKTLPNLIDASTEPWLATLSTLARVVKESGAFVPGHGDVGTAEDVTEFRNYLATLRRLVHDAQGQGKTGDALVDAVLPALKEKYGQWEFFEYFAKSNIADTAAELRGEKKLPRPADVR